MGSKAVGGSFKKWVDRFTHLPNSPLLLSGAETLGTPWTAYKSQTLLWPPGAAALWILTKGILCKLNRQPVRLTHSSGLSLSSSAGIWGRRQSRPQIDPYANRARSQPNCVPSIQPTLQRSSFYSLCPGEFSGETAWVVKSLSSAVKQTCIQNLAPLHAGCDLGQAV